MRPIRPPGDGKAWRPGEQQQQSPRPCHGAHPLVQHPSRRRWQAIVAEYHARATRQPRQRRPQRIADALVGHQEQIGERAGLAGLHRRLYRRAMAETEPAAAIRLADVRARIAHAAALAGRAADAVALIAISKTKSVDEIRPLLDAGQRLFGENRVQEAQAKWPELRADYPDVRLHLVGQLQSNKAEDAVALFDAIHAVDRLSLVTALARAMDKTGKRPDCFLQVNIGEEAQKGGCAIADLPALLAEARAAGLPVVGLMAVPPADTEPAPYFALLAKLAKDHGLARLSMGMSGDYETAALLGATEVRIGTALFGARA